MNVLLPSAPSGAKTAPAAGDVQHGSRELPDGDFAAALAETAGESGEDGGGDEPRMRKSDDASAFPRLARRLETREARGGQAGEAGAPHFGDAREIAVGTPPKSARRAESKVEVKNAAAGEARDAAEAVRTPAAPEGAPAAAAAREVLAVLGVDLGVRPERAAAAPEIAGAARKATGARGIGLDALGLDKARSGPGGFDDEALEETEILPVRVVRQEKHFQAAGVEARRWQIAQDAFEGARAMTAPDAARPQQADAPASRERPLAGAVAARAAEVAMPVAGPVAPAPGVDVAPGAVGLQIGDRLQQALSAPAEPGAPPPPASTGFEPETRQAFAPAVRTIKLQLNPVELGAVTILVSGNEKGVRIEIAAELADTVNKVENDRNVLAARLNGAGYNVTEINVARFAGQGMDADTRDQGARQGSAQEPFAGTGARDGGPHSGGQHAGRHFGGATTHGGMGGESPPGAVAAQAVAGVSYAGRFRPI